MAENNQVQLKREEIVDQDVVLSDINPSTNTGSVLDDTTGGSLNKTLERILNSINNKLARNVNSVNGRTGVVVIDKGDVNLGNVDNVSFDDIKRWVLEQLAKAFSKHTIKLFNNLHEAAMFAEDHDQTYSGTAFFSDKGYTDSSMEYVDNRSYIGYFEYDEGNEILTMHYLPISTVGSTDNSIIYNTNIKGDFRGGKIGVNIYKYEDALKLYNASSGETATDLSILNSGLYIDKSKIAPSLFSFDGCYGNGDPYDTNALLYFRELQPADAIGVSMTLNGESICTVSNTFTKQTFKINDLILCNFSDYGCYNSNGSLKGGIDAQLLLRQPALGKVVQAPTRANPDNAYIIHFFTIKPLLGYGLTYSPNHNRTGQIPDNMLSVSPFMGSPLDNPASTDIRDMSGLVMFNDNDRYIDNSKPFFSYYMSTPIGIKRVNHSDTTDNGLAINPTSSLCTYPSNQSQMELNNVPTNAPSNSPTEGFYAGGYLGINLIKSILTINDELKGNNISGLRINSSNDTLAPEWFGNPELDYDSIVHSGGLSVNVGDFLEIGKSLNDIQPETPPSLEDYYNTGKVNVRVDGQTIGDVGDNTLGVSVSHYVNYVQKDINHALGGGLVYTDGFNADVPSAQLSISRGLTINRGLGLRMSHYDRFGEIPQEYSYNLLTTEPAEFNPIQYFVKDGNDYRRGRAGEVWAENTWYDRVTNVIQDKGFLAVSVIDKQYTDEDMGEETDNRQRGYGGLRYMIGDSAINEQSAVGLRVNDSTSTYGHELRLGSKAIGIDENNVVQVQRYRETDDEYKDINPLVIKGWNESAIYPYVHINKLREYEICDTPEYLPGESRNPYGIPSGDTIYFVKSENKHYVYDESDNRFEPMFIFEPKPLGGGEWNKVYVEAEINNVDHTYVGRAFKWDEGYTVNLPFSWDPSTQQYIDDPLYSVTAVTASNVLAYYAAQSVCDDDHRGYYYNGTFYKNSTHTWPLPAGEREGDIYFDISTPYPEVGYRYTNGAYTPLIWKPGTSTSVTHEDLIPCDVNNNGTIDSVDASNIIAFYTFISTSHPDYPQFDTMTTREQLAEYMRLFCGIEETTEGYVLIHGTDENGSFMPGLDINVNESQGMTTRLNGDIRNSVSVKIYDTSSGNNIITEDGSDPTTNDLSVLYQGGLRFTTDGYLAVRVNDQRSYDATTPSGRMSGDWCRPAMNSKGGPQQLGSRGLMVYPNNVLGIQLNVGSNVDPLDNGELAFDEYGSLHISPNYQGGGGEVLTFTDSSGQTITYNGHEPVTIALGPGLIIEDDSTPT